ncbi:MAG: threonylcarbamoyl-AMP synthase [Bacillaceae bacterium]|nr:threonylcarbamoyl-AMP synthase [Bacillaceae bacterium]
MTEAAYETKYWNVTTEEAAPDHPSIQKASHALINQEVIAFPTETVYGLGADATSDEAVKKIFAAKGRPSDNPLIVHIGDQEDVHKLVTEVPEVAQKLMDAFWPGPLTIILTSNGTCASSVTAGLSTVGIRMPDHPVARALLQASGLPVAAPSANRSGRPSPTSAAHVLEDLSGRIYGVLDGGTTGVGVESTVVECTGEVPVILRPGGVSREELEQIVPAVNIDPALNNKREKPKSPGMKYTHYAPVAPLWLVKGDLEFFQRQIDRLQSEGKIVGVMVSKESAGALKASHLKTYGSRENLATIAAGLYDALRSFDHEPVDIILAETFPNDGIGAAVMNRLEKASTGIIE